MSKQGEESEKDLNEFATNVCRHVVDLKKKTKRISILRKKVSNHSRNEQLLCRIL